jgi:hypothetical protein
MGAAGAFNRDVGPSLLAVKIIQEHLSQRRPFSTAWRWLGSRVIHFIPNLSTIRQLPLAKARASAPMRTLSMVGCLNV